MRLFSCCCICIVLTITGLTQALQFTTQPAMVKGSGATWNITFAVSESTDVEVSIVDKADSSVVRHLAAGVLGANPPAPLTPNSLSQAVSWDGNNDYGQTVASPQNMLVRVRAGMGIRQDAVAGGDPYEYSPADPASPCGGMVQGVDGSFFLMYKPSGVNSTVVRQYNDTGAFLKTIFPIPGSKPVADYAGWGLNLLSSADYSPKTQDYYGPLMTSSPLGYYDLGGFLAGPAPGQLGLIANISNRIWAINEDGTCNSGMVTSNRSFLASPVTPSLFYYSRGAKYFAVAPDYSYFLMGGFAASDTGFWSDGRLYKVDMSTRNATVLFNLDSVVPAASRGAALGNDYRTEIAGVAIGDSGRVFVCDRLFNRLLVLSSTGTILKSFSIQYPDNVAWCKSTGALYATRMSRDDGFYLDKIADWKTETTVTSSTLIKKSDGLYGIFGYCDAGSASQTLISAVNTSKGVLVWLVARIGGVVIYRDAGGSITEYKTFRKLSKQGFTGLKRMAVDPLTETAYVGASGTPVYKVANWNRPAFVPCSTAAGGTVLGYDLAVDPRNRHLFVRERDNGGPFQGSIRRYAMGARLTPAPLSKLATHIVVDSFCQDGSMSVGTADLGFAVAPNGHLASISKTVYCLSSGGNTIRYYPVYDTQSTYRPLTLVTGLSDHPASGAGMRFDTRGNLYVGMRPAGSPVNLPSVITGDGSFTLATGKIQRYAATGSLNGSLFTGTVAAPDKIYNVDFGQIGNAQLNASACFCMTAMFGMDNWGRLYVPNGCFQKITVTDNAGNRTLRFGTYGNPDDVVLEAAGVSGTAGSCYMAYPFAVDASDDFIYAADPGNMTLVRFQKTFVLDNIPGMSSSLSLLPAKIRGSLALSAFPNPLTRDGRIGAFLPSAAKMTLDIVDVSGRVVAQVADGTYAPGAHAFAWHGAVSGVYFLRLKSDCGVLVRRVVLAR